MVPSRRECFGSTQAFQALVERVRKAREEAEGEKETVSAKETGHLAQLITKVRSLDLAFASSA
jgi:hypothetical protein